ncbi:hypothetical protein V7O66_06100 [Methanolobus sp. ZRKC3]|uniref:hypothetical protein n=1 Tax=Methanolobus sp. ZRKC3 TaxID=3125786 RepID=UPI00324C572A
METIRMMPFFKRFFLYVTVLFIAWSPVGGRYFSAPNVNLENFILFYIPLNFIPFMALILASALGRSRTIRILIMGLVLTIAFNLLIIFLQLMFISYQEQLLYIYAIGRIAFPFLLWVTFTYDMIFSLEPTTMKAESE